MKGCLTNFLTCLLLCFTVLFLFGWFFEDNGIFLIVFVAFLLAILVTILSELYSRVENLEKKLSALTGDGEAAADKPAEEKSASLHQNEPGSEAIQNDNGPAI